MHTLTDPRVYLSSNLKNIEIGTKEEASKNGWVSMQEGIDEYGQEKWLEMVVELNCVTPQ